MKIGRAFPPLPQGAAEKPLIATVEKREQMVKNLTFKARIAALFAALAVLCLACVFLFNSTPSVHAADGTPGVLSLTYNEQTEYFSNVKDLQSSFTEVANDENTYTSEDNRIIIKLHDNYTVGIDEEFSFGKSGVYVTFDLNGYILRGKGTSNVLTFNCGNFLLIDSQSNSTAAEHQHNYYVAENGLWMVDDGSEDWQMNYAAAPEEDKGTITGGIVTGGNLSAGYGGGVLIRYENAVLNVNGGTIAGNYAASGGGGIGASFCDSLIINGGMIAGNVSTGSMGFGGGIIFYCVDGATAYINGGIIKDNVAINGAGVFSMINLVVNGGEIYDNTALKVEGNTLSGLGGGVYSNAGLSISGGDIHDNLAEYGGGLFATTIVMSGSTVYDNQANVSCGALYAATAKISGGYVNGSILIENIQVSSISGGHYAEGSVYNAAENANTVYGLPVTSGYAVVYLNDGSDYPYAVYVVGEALTYAVEDISVVYGEEIVPEISGNLYNVDVSYSYTDADGQNCTGLPRGSGTYNVTATFAAYADDATKTLYFQAEVTFEVKIVGVQLTADAEVSVGADGAASVNYISVKGIAGGDDVTVIPNATILADGRVMVTYSLRGADAANYIAPEPAYFTVTTDLNNIIDELEDAVAALKNALETKADAETLTNAIDDLNAAIDALKGNIESEVDRLEGLIEQGGADTEELEKTLAALDEAYKAADTLIRADFAAADTKLSDSIAALKTALESADDGLQSAIDAVESSLNDAVKELNETIGTNESDIEGKLAAVQQAYAAADALLRTDFAAADSKLSDSISALESAYTAADEAIWDAIEQLQSALDEKAPAGHNNAITWTTFAIAILALAAGAAALVRSFKKWGGSGQ